MGIPEGSGVIVTYVEGGSPADNVGIQPQDIIAKVNKAKITSLKKYNSEMSKAVQKKGVMLLVKRGNSNFFVGLRME